MDKLRADQGIDSPQQVTLRDATGAPYTGYAGTESLSAVVWAGEDMAPIAGVATPSWPGNGASTSLVNVTINGAATASLEPATYRVRLLVAGQEAYEGELELGFSPGTAAVPAIYCKYRDLTDLVPTLEKYRAKLDDQAGYLQQRIDATQWFQDLIHRHWRGGQGISTDYAFIPGISFLGGYPGAQAPLYRTGARSAIVQGWLDAGRLDVTRQVARACAAYAVSLVGEQMELVDQKGDWGAFARKWSARAEDWASLITAELDTDGDSVNDTVVRLGIHDTLEG